MPSMEESRRQVRAGLDRLNEDGGIDHDAILAAMEAEIDQHIHEQTHGERRPRKRRHGDRDENNECPRGQFRFKNGISDPRKHGHKRRRRSASLADDEHKVRRTRDSVSNDSSAHPFPREPFDPARDASQNAQTAFRESLFDALADDEGAAYWESVYNQPIHIYPRPTVETPQGALEAMDDDAYAVYVQARMWERTHPHIVRERERKEKRRKEEEEDTARRREEFVRRKERAAWERAQEEGARRFAGLDEEDDEKQFEYVFDFDGRTGGASKRENVTRRPDYDGAWAKYLAAWEAFKLKRASDGADPEPPDLGQRIPWPVLPSKPVVKANIEAFFQHIPAGSDGRSQLQSLKAERVRWHPDKIQQRFGGQVDSGTMQKVTAIFQIVDAMVEVERKRLS